jgi:hypothetical protein
MPAKTMTSIASTRVANHAGGKRRVRRRVATDKGSGHLERPVGGALTRSAVAEVARQRGERAGQVTHAPSEQPPLVCVQRS